LSLKLGSLLRMTHVDQELVSLIAKLHGALPEAHLWSGSAARACQAEIQKLVDELHRLRANLIALPWLG
jgi:hypothetical protein